MQSEYNIQKRTVKKKKELKRRLNYIYRYVF